MSSSDSEDDCYGNVAKKLQSMKNKFTELKADCSVYNTSSEIDDIVKKADFGAKTESKPTEDASKEEEELIELADDAELNELLASSSKSKNVSTRRVTRSSKRNQHVSLDEIPPPTRRRSNEETVETTRGRRGRGRGRRGRNNSSTENSEQTDSSTSRGQSERGRRRGRGQRTPRGRRGRGRNRVPDLMSLMFPIFNSSNFIGTDHTSNYDTSNYPTYSVGNTDEYPDQCENQGLFSKKPQSANDVVVIEENDSFEDNEELSVKVYWQNSEYFKFGIRKYQKISSIFDFFSKKENVSLDKLFFTFNDRILKPDDTPDSIDYNIAKFIDGGIVNQSVLKLVANEKGNITNGIKLKFQCQNVKKPFETVIRPDDKLSVAMLKCAEYFEKSLDKLRFEFDGDLISGKSTPQDLELEGGECIDVKILS